MKKSVVGAYLLFKFDFHEDLQEDFFQLNRAPWEGRKGMASGTFVGLGRVSEENIARAASSSASEISMKAVCFDLRAP